MIYEIVYEGARQYKQLEFLAGHSAKVGRGGSDPRQLRNAIFKDFF